MYFGKSNKKICCITYAYNTDHKIRDLLTLASEIKGLIPKMMPRSKPSFNGLRRYLQTTKP